MDFLRNISINMSSNRAIIVDFKRVFSKNRQGYNREFFQAYFRRANKDFNKETFKDFFSKDKQC